MSYDFASYVTQCFLPSEQRIKEGIQNEIKRCTKPNRRPPSRNKVEQISKSIIAEETWNFVRKTTNGDLRLAELLLSFIQMKYKNDDGYKESIRQVWMNRANQSLNPSVQMDIFNEVSSVQGRLSTMLPLLPNFSWYISLPVRLAEPFASKDDNEIHILENPICREKIFGVPMVRPSTWKGNLRWMAVMSGLDSEVRERLFGNKTDKEADFHKGRLFFYPTLFDRIDFEVMTPLDRVRRFPKKGQGPILIECVRHHPNNEAIVGEFNLLYLAPSTAWQNPKEIIQQAATDLEQTTTILTEMLLSYGFSAKKTSGFGTIEDSFRDRQGDKLGKLSLVGVSLQEAESIRSEFEHEKTPITHLSFGNCTEMCQQAKRLTETMREASHE